MTQTKRVAYTGLKLVALALLGLQTSCLTLAAYSMAQKDRRFEAMRYLNRDAHAWAMADGGAIKGKLEVISEFTNSYGAVRAVPALTLTCAGHEVSLVPDTEQMRWQVQRISNLRVSDRGDWIDPAIWLDDWPSDWAAYIRRTRCRPDGSFTFDSAPDGRYLLISEITSREPDYSNSGGLILKPVVVTRAMDLEVTLRTGFLDGALVPR